MKRVWIEHQPNRRVIPIRRLLSFGRLPVCLLLVTLLAAGCGSEMDDQPKLEPFEYSAFFPDGMSARPVEPNTVARGRLWADEHLYAGQVDGRPAETFPFAVTDEVMARGREQYNIACAPCHGYSGYGNGIIVQRGFTPPPSFHSERLRTAAVGYLFDVITNGFGAMYSYGDRVPPADRWAIIAYVRALQLSQNATVEDLPADVRQQLESEQETGQ